MMNWWKDKERVTCSKIYVSTDFIHISLIKREKGSIYRDGLHVIAILWFFIYSCNSDNDIVIGIISGFTKYTLADLLF